MKFSTFAILMLIMATLGFGGGYLLGRADGVALEQSRWVGHFDVEVAGRAKAEEYEAWYKQKWEDCAKMIYQRRDAK